MFKKMMTANSACERPILFLKSHACVILKILILKILMFEEFVTLKDMRKGIGAIIEYYIALEAVCILS
jgi:hypothetical protein